MSRNVRQAALVLAAVAAAFLLSALTPVALTAPLDPEPRALALILVLSLGASLVLALPFFLAVRTFGRVGLRSCLFAGGGIGGIPVAVFGTLGMFAEESAYDAGAPSVVDHVPTLHGIGQLLLFIGETTALGIASAFVFWLVLVACRALPAINRDYAVMPRAVPAAGLLVLAVALTTLILSLPELTKDGSCHNVLRDRNYAAPSLTMRLTIDKRDWPKLRQIAAGFAAAHRLSYRDDGQAFRLLQMSLCTEPGIAIEMDEESRVAGIATDAAPAGELSNVAINVYAENPNAPWQPVTRDFVRTLDAAWPGKLTVTGDNGVSLKRPPWLETGR